jgi:uncharacterized protein
MQFTLYPRVDAFVQAVQPILERDEPRNNLLLGTAVRLRASLAAVPVCATIDVAGDLVAAALLTSYALLLADSSPAGLTAMPYLVAALRRQQVTVPRVTAPVPLATRFAEHWGEATSVTVTLERPTRAWVLRQVVTPRASTGQLRPARAADTDLIADWLWRFDHEALGAGTPVAEAYAGAHRRIAGQELFVWDDGEPVAMAGTTRPTRHGQAINAVYTPVQWRGRGYATACVAALSQRLLDSGLQFCTLSTDPTNPVSEAVYAKIGYRSIAEFETYSFSQA